MADNPNYMRQETKKYWQAMAILIGTIIGLGPFGIPYAFSKAGFMVGLLYLGVLTIVILFMHLIYGEIVLRTPTKHRLIGYAEIYLGKSGKRAASASMIIGIFGSLLAYTIVGGNFSQTLFSPWLQLDTVAWSMVFFAIMAFFVITDFKTGAPAELAMSVGLLAIFLIIIIRTLPDISSVTLFSVASPRDLFLPYGVVLFALTGSSAIPELRDVLMGDGKMKRIIVIGTLIPAIIYALFAFGVVGSLGANTSRDAVSGLTSHYGSWMAVLGGLVGILATSTSFIVLALVMKHSFIYDLRIPKIIATIVVLLVPLILFFYATQDFVKVMGFVGAVMVGVEGILMLKLHRKAKVEGKRIPEYSVRIPPAFYYLLGLMFIAGTMYEIIYTIR